MASPDDDNHHQQQEERKVSSPEEARCGTLARAYATHRARVGKGDSFFSSGVGSRSKSYEVHDKARRIARENMQLVEKLQMIESASSKRLAERRYVKEAAGPKFQEIRDEARERKRQELARENGMLEKRLQGLKPYYSVRAFAKARCREKKVLRLRKRDHASPYLGQKRRRPEGATAAAQSSSSSSVPLAGSPPPPEKMVEPSLAMLEAVLKEKAALENKKKPALPPIVQQHGGGGVKKKALSSSSHGTTTTLSYDAKRSGSTLRQKDQARHRRESESSIVAMTHQDTVEVRFFGDEETHSPAPNFQPRTTERRRSSSLLRASFAAHVVLDTKREYVLKKGGKPVRCSVTISAQEPYTVWTELHVLVKTDRDGKFVAKTVATVSEALPEIVNGNMTHSPEWEDAYDLQEMLLIMFRDADEDGNGTLSREEFEAMLNDNELGLSETELKVVLDEVDENEDDVLSYDEFIPVAIDLIQSFKARRFAKRQQASIEQRVKEATALALPELHETFKLAQEHFKEADQRRQGTLAKHDFRRCLKHESLKLKKHEQTRTVEKMPVDAFGRVIYKKYDEIARQVRSTSLRRLYLEAEASPMETFLYDLCKEQERLCSEEDPDVLRGVITLVQLQSILANPEIGLTRLQRTSVISDAESIDGMVEYYDFVPTAAKAIEKLRDPHLLEAKTKVLSKNLASKDATSTAAKHDSDLRRELSDAYDQYDDDKSGALETTEFQLCIESLELGLAKAEIDTLVTEADVNRDGVVDRKEFDRFVEEGFLDLVKERRLDVLRDDLARLSRGDQVDTSNFEVPQTVFDELKHPHWDRETTAGHRNLTALFRKVDASKEGRLSSADLHRFLTALDLGLSSYQQARLMAEADEDEDGHVTYSEFVGPASRLLQTHRAKTKALLAWDDRMRAIDDRVDQEHSKAKTHLIEAIHIVEHAFQEAGKIQAALDRAPRGSFAVGAAVGGSPSSLHPGERTSSSSSEGVNNSARPVAGEVYAGDPRYAPGGPAAKIANFMISKLRAHQLAREQDAERQKLRAQRASRGSMDRRPSGVTPAWKRRRSSVVRIQPTFVAPALVKTPSSAESKRKRRQTGSSSSNFPRLRRQSFLKCLAVPHAKLSRAMIDGIASRMPASKIDGLTATAHFSEVVFRVHAELTRHAVVESLPPTSTLEMHVRALCRDAEEALRKRLIKEHPNTAPGTASTDADRDGASRQGQQKDASSSSSSNPEPGLETPIGVLPAAEACRALTRAKHLRLSRQQLLCVMSLATDCEANEDTVHADPLLKAAYRAEDAILEQDDDGSDDTSSSSSSSSSSGANAPPAMLHSAKFASCAAAVVADFFDVGKLQIRTSLQTTVQSQASVLLKGDGQPALLRVLGDLFLKRDLAIAAAQPAAQLSELDSPALSATRRTPDAAAAAASGGENNNNSAPPSPNPKPTKGRTGSLPVHDLTMVLASLPLLDLTRSEVSALLANAPYDDGGNVLYDEFLQDAPETFALVAHDRKIRCDKTYGADAEPSVANAVDRAQMTRVCRDLVKRSDLVKNGTDMTIVFRDRAPDDPDPRAPRKDTASRRHLRNSTPDGVARRRVSSIRADAYEAVVVPETHLALETRRFAAVVRPDGRPVRAPETGAFLAVEVDVRVDQVDSRRVRLDVDLVDPDRLAAVDTDTLVEPPISKQQVARLGRRVALGEPLSVDLKLPSLAAVDPEAGNVFVHNLASNLRLELHHDHTLSLDLLPRKNNNKGNNKFGQSSPRDVPDEPRRRPSSPSKNPAVDDDDDEEDARPRTSL